MMHVKLVLKCHIHSRMHQPLQSSAEGLTEREAKKRLEAFGPNRLAHKKRNPVLQYLGYMWNPLSWVKEMS